MFTGIIEDLGVVTQTQHVNGVRRITLRSEVSVDGMRLGDSIALNGVCLTAVAVESNGFTVEAVPETLRRTNLGELVLGGSVNIERPLVTGSRVGGHFVQGHIDTTVELIDKSKDGGSDILRFSTPTDLGRFIVSKGFVALDGVSLTVVDPVDASFAVVLIPHTRKSVTIGDIRLGYRANLEVDILAKYGVVRDIDEFNGPSIRQLHLAGFVLDVSR